MKIMFCHATEVGLLLAVLLSICGVGMAQTGQALIGNPLLSPAKQKEVRRQIASMGAAQQEPSQASPMSGVAMNIAPAPANGLPPPPFVSEVDAARSAMVGLQVSAIVGSSAFLSMPSTRVLRAEAARGAESGISYYGGQNPARDPKLIVVGQHESVSVLVRHRVRSYVNGFDVIPSIDRDSVRLDLVDGRAVFFARLDRTPAPAAQSSRPTLIRPQLDYLNRVSPSGTGPGTATTALSQSELVGQPSAQPVVEKQRQTVNQNY